MIKCDESKPYIFISYSHKDSDRVYEIIQRLYDSGYNVWYDGGIDPGTEWDQNIATHVKGCSYFIAFVSEGYISSENCKDELNYARDLDKERLLVYLEDVALPDGLAMRMNRMQAIWWNRYASSNMDEAYEKLFSSQGIDKAKIRDVNVMQAQAMQAQAMQVPVMQAPVMQTPEMQQHIVQQPMMQQSVMPISMMDTNEKNKTIIWPWIVGIITCITLIIVLVLFLVIGKNDDNEKDESTKEYSHENEEIVKDYENREFEWYLKKAEAGDEIAMIYLAECYYYGIYGAKEDGFKAFEWYSKAVKGKDSEGRANCGLGNCYYFGIGTEMDYELAAKYYQKAVEKDNPDAQMNLGHMYEFGNGVDRDCEKALLYYEESANAGNVIAMCNIAQMYYEGIGVKVDYEKAMSYYEMAEFEEDSFAMNKLGYMYEMGQGTEVDFEMALIYYEEAAIFGSYEGMYNAGRMYYEGLGTEMNKEKAIEYLQKAADAGIEEAISMLDEIS